MDIKDIIGQGKAFEPPFYADDDGTFIFDNQHQMVLETRGYGHLKYIFDEPRLSVKVYPMIAQHIVELLNAFWNENANQKL